MNKKYIKFAPLVFWLFYFVLNLQSSIRLIAKRQQAFALASEHTMGSLPSVYKIASYSSFFDELILLIIAVVLFVFFDKKYVNGL